MTRKSSLLLLVIASFLANALNAQTDGPLGDLFLAKEGGLAHYSSYDSSGKNADFRVLAPGQTLVLADHKGAGVLRRWWLTIAPRNVVEIHRSLIIRCYWDGETEPSVEMAGKDPKALVKREMHSAEQFSAPPTLCNWLIQLSPGVFLPATVLVLFLMVDTTFLPITVSTSRTQAA